MTTTAKKLVPKKPKFDYKKIKTFEDACEALGIDPTKLPELTLLSEEFVKPIVSYYKLVIVYKAINNGWKPDWSNGSQYKYYPWFGLSSGFGFSCSDYVYAGTDTYVGSRLCTDTREKAGYIAKQFEALYQEYLLFSE